jgi:hypothetical protein
MNHIGMVARVTAAVLAFAVCGAAVAGSSGATDTVKLSGCLVRGEDGDGFLLINVPAEPVAGTTTDTAIAPTAVGTSGRYANMFYWLDDDGDLEQHTGHQVEIEGDFDGDAKDGELTIDRKDDWTELEIESDGDEMRARVPNSSVVAAPNSDRKIRVMVRKVDVENIRMLDATCR